MLDQEVHLLGETKQFRINFHLRKNRLNNIHDFYPIFKNKHQLDSVLLTTLEYPLKNEKLPIYQAFYNRKDKSFDISKDFYQFQEGFVHARNYIQDYFTNDQYLDFVVFDHGYDVPPFPGGKSKLFSYDKVGYKLNEKFFDCESSFTFSGCSGDWDNDGRPELILFDLMSIKGSTFYRNDGSKLVKDDTRFPDLKSDLNFFPLAGTSFSSPNGIKKMAIGSLGDKVSSEADIVLTPDKSGHFDSNKVTQLPKRRGGADWVCVSIDPVRFVGDDVDHLLAVYHDGPVQNGFIELYKQTSDQTYDYYNADKPIAEDKDCWLYRYRTLNFSIKNNNPDSIIVLKSRGLKQFVARDYNFILLVKSNNEFIDMSECLSPLIGKEFSGVITHRNETTQLDDIIFFDNHGNYYYCHNKN
jgi:hypothetical protein